MPLPSPALPKACREPEKWRADLDTHGYCLIENAIAPQDLDAVQRRLAEQALGEIEAGVAFEDSGPQQKIFDEKGQFIAGAFTAEKGGINQRVWMLVNKGEEFWPLALNEDISLLCGHVIGPDCLLSSMSANIAKPGGVPMDLHTDQWWMPAPELRDATRNRPGALKRTPPPPPPAGSAEPQSIAPAVAVNVIYMVSDFTDENGGTRILPGSHLKGRQPPQQAYDDVAHIALTGKAGTAAVMDARLWHGTGPNRANAPRYGVMAFFCAPQFRQQENFVVGLLPELRERAPKRLLELLGFKPWGGYGRIESPAAEFIRADMAVGRLTPKSSKAKI